MGGGVASAFGRCLPAVAHPWKAFDEAFPTTRHQRCWLHKTLNVLEKLPKSLQPNARICGRSGCRRAGLRRKRRDSDFRREIRAKAVECLIEDHGQVVTFLIFPPPAYHVVTTRPEAATACDAWPPPFSRYEEKTGGARRYSPRPPATGREGAFRVPWLTHP